MTNLEFTDTCTGVANSGWLDDGLSVAGDWECSFSGDLAQFGTMSGGIEGLKDEENEGQMSGVLTSGPPLGDVEWTGSWTETTQYGEFSFEFSEQGFDIVGDGTFTTSE
ncbi:MAG: hypothetical protein GY913_16885 [Proteobacteria bacterium]|nr:hypothetical protein [Pseudomonadota bacterium]